MVQLIVTRITDVRPHGDNLSIVTVDGHEVVANRREDGSFRWAAGEPCVYVPENTILPEDVLKERGYFDEAKGKGLLGGSKGNRVKMQRFAGHESRGLLFKVEGGPDVTGPWAGAYVVTRGDQNQHVNLGDDVAEFFGATEYVPQ